MPKPDRLRRFAAYAAGPAFVGMLAGCVGAFVPIHTAEKSGAKAFEATWQIRSVNAQEAQGLTLLGQVEGYSCKNKLWDSAPTADAALLQLKVSAAQRGATAISEVTCEERGTSLATNCWKSVRCQGTAYR